MMDRVIALLAISIVIAVLLLIFRAAASNMGVWEKFKELNEPMEYHTYTPSQGLTNDYSGPSGPSCPNCNDTGQVRGHRYDIPTKTWYNFDRCGCSAGRRY
jgi:hypothetical protein